MKKSRFTDQSIGFIRQTEAGMTVSELASHAANVDNLATFLNDSAHCRQFAPRKHQLPTPEYTRTENRALFLDTTH